jgi:hypothetical protein
MDERVHRQAGDQELPRRQREAGAPLGRVERQPARRSERAPVALDQRADRLRIAGPLAGDEAEEFGEIPLRQAERRELPVEGAEPQPFARRAQRDVPRIEVVVDEGMGQREQPRPPVAEGRDERLLYRRQYRIL